MKRDKLNSQRRDFIKALSFGTAHLLFSNPLFAGQTGFRDEDPLQKVTLGNSGIETTLLGMGTGIHASNRSAFLTRQDKQKSLNLLIHAYEKGVRFFDCADTYGTHGLIAEAMKSMERDQITLSSKIWFRNGGIPEPERPDANIVVDRFRKELDTDYIDLVQIHCMVDGNWTDSQKRQMDLLENLKSKGVIRAHGVSVHSLDAMKSAANSTWTDIVHARINPYGIAMDRPNPEEVVQTINQLHQAGKGVIGMKLVGNGKLRDESDKIDHSLRFVLGLKSVDMIIVGFETPEQINNYLDRMHSALNQLNG